MRKRFTQRVADRIATQSPHIQILFLLAIYTRCFCFRQNSPIPAPRTARNLALAQTSPPPGSRVCMVIVLRTISLQFSGMSRARKHLEQTTMDIGSSNPTAHNPDQAGNRGRVKPPGIDGRPFTRKCRNCNLNRFPYQTILALCDLSPAGKPIEPLPSQGLSVS